MNCIEATGFKSPRFVGEDHPSRKLSNADITHIRDMHGLYTQRSLASIWKISQSQVGRILRKESWAHIPSVDGVKEGSAHDRRN